MNIKQLWELLAFWRKRVKEEGVKEGIKEGSIMIGYVGYDEKPTQQDKPSNHSSLTLAEAEHYIKNGIGDRNRNFRVFNVSATNSMEPWMDDNCKCLCEVINDRVLAHQPLDKGDVVIYYQPKNGKFIVHRILTQGSKKDGFYIKGDNNYFKDSYVPVENVKYRLVSIWYCRQNRTGD